MTDDKAEASLNQSVSLARRRFIWAAALAAVAGSAAMIAGCAAVSQEDSQPPDWFTKNRGSRNNGGRR
jgi:hypothetical protein